MKIMVYIWVEILWDKINIAPKNDKAFYETKFAAMTQSA